MQINQCILCFFSQNLLAYRTARHLAVRPAGRSLARSKGIPCEKYLAESVG